MNYESIFRICIRWSVTVCVCCIAACQSTPANFAESGADPNQSKQERHTAELQVVDCLLPGQVRFLGNRSYTTPRRPTLTTAADCKIRGGEFVAYDRADYKTALAVWLPSAESGDAEAQVNVGEIFERGLGGQPNYAAALHWYQLAAEQGSKRAKFNLGTMYEQGLGVDKNMVLALNWYREAWGLPADDITFRSVIDSEANKLKETLESKVEKQNRRIALLESQLKALAQDASGSKEEVGELNAMIAEMKTEKAQSQTRIEEVVRLRQPGVIVGSTKLPSSAPDITLKDRNFGRYFALVIGNQNYQHLNNLETPLNDVDTISTMLEKHYGFAVKQLNDASNIEVMEAINNLNDIVGENDNLLIYYAGHGSRLQSSDSRDVGFWLPVNADPPPRDTFWISNEFVTRHIARLKAKRILVVADSCFAGMLSSAPGFLLLSKSNTEPDEEYLNYKFPRRSRLLLASGGDSPVLDSGGGENSVFARAFIDVLQNNNDLITGPEVFSRVKELVIRTASTMDFDQEPVYSAIKGAGHEIGDFFFVPIQAHK